MQCEEGAGVLPYRSDPALATSPPTSRPSVTQGGPERAPRVTVYRSAIVARRQRSLVRRWTMVGYAPLPLRIGRRRPEQRHGWSYSRAVTQGSCPPAWRSTGVGCTVHGNRAMETHSCNAIRMCGNVPLEDCNKKKKTGTLPPSPLRLELLKPHVTRG